MTVAMGFECMGGIVICADTKEIFPDRVKVDTGKIRTYQGQDGTFVITGDTNDSDVMDLAMMRIGEELTAKPHLHTKTWYRRREQMTKRDNLVEDSIRRIMDGIREESILPFPADQQPWLHLLVGAVIGGEYDIYKATPTAVLPIPGNKEPVGIGIAQAAALLDRFHVSSLCREEMELFSIYIMRLVKKYVPGVEGFTDVAAVDIHGRVKQWPESKVIEVEGKFASFDNHEKAILGALCSRPSNDGSTEIGAEIKSKVLGAGHPDQVLGGSTEFLRNLRRELWDVAESVETAFQKGGLPL